MNAVISYSRGANKFDNQPQQCRAENFDEFAKLIDQDRSIKKGQAYFCGPLSIGPHHDIAKYPGESCWRLASLAQMRQFLAFDIDAFSSPEMFSTLLIWLNTFDAFGYTTASHTPEVPRFRFTLHLDRLISREEGNSLGLAIEKQFFNDFGEGTLTFDKSVYRNEQPSYTPLASGTFYRFKGKQVDVNTLLTMFPAPLPIVDGRSKSDIAYEKTPCPVHLRPLIRAALFSISADDRTSWGCNGPCAKIHW